MKTFLLLILLMVSLNTHAECLNAFEMKTEKDQIITLCQDGDLQITQSCQEKPGTCELLRDLELKAPATKVLRSSIKGNPGSRICNALGWKVHMAELFDGSQVCTCLHPSGEYISCSSLSDYYQLKSKAKK